MSVETKAVLSKTPFTRRVATSILVALTLATLVSCGGGVGGGGNHVPGPTITSVSVTCSPASIQTGQTSQCTATVTGTGSYSSAVTWSASAGTINSSGLFTASSNASTVTVTATSVQDTSKTGTKTVTVTAVPTITSVSVSCNPTSVQTGQTSQCTATVTGTGSYSSAVTWSVNDVAGGNSTVGTIFSSGLYTGPPTVPSPAAITVKATSQADTTKSATASVSLSYPAPTITTITPDSVSVGSPDTNLAVFGAGFTPASVVNLDGTTLATSYVSAAEVTAKIRASSQAVAGTHTVTVLNPMPGGGTSSAASFTVDNLIPTLTSVTPSSFIVGSASTQVQITGTNFLPASTATLNSASISSNYVSSTQMVATISSSSLSASTTLNLSVTNPAPGGGTSATAQLVVSNGAPTGGSDVPGLIQAHLSDPDAFVLVGGVVGSSASQSAGLTTRPHVLLGPFDATSTTPSCTKGGPTGGFEANGGVCVAGVSWMPQVPPIDPSDGINYQDVWNNKTANCGEASLAIVKAQLQGLEPSPTDILDINNYIIENSVKFPDCPRTSAEALTQHYLPSDISRREDLYTNSSATSPNWR